MERNSTQWTRKNKVLDGSEDYDLITRIMEQASFLDLVYDKRRAEEITTIDEY